MSSVRVFQLILLLVLVVVSVAGRTILVSLDTRHLQNQGKKTYTARVAASANGLAVPLIAIGIGCLLLPWVLGDIELLTRFKIDGYFWVFTLAGWVLLLPSMLFVVYNLGKWVKVAKGVATFYRLFLPLQSVKLEDIAVVKERFRRHRAGVLPVYQCVYDLYVKSGDGQKKIYTLARMVGSVQLLSDCFALNKVEWKATTPKRYTRNPLIYPDLKQAPIPKGSSHQELYLLTIPNLLTRQMINNNLPDVG